MTLNLLFESSSSVVIGAASTYQQGKAQLPVCPGCQGGGRWAPLALASGRATGVFKFPSNCARRFNAPLLAALRSRDCRGAAHLVRGRWPGQATAAAAATQDRRRLLGRSQGPGHSRQGATRQPGLPPCLIRPRPNMRHDAAAAARPLAGLLGTPSPRPWELNSSSS